MSCDKSLDPSLSSKSSTVHVDVVSTTITTSSSSFSTIPVPSVSVPLVIPTTLSSSDDANKDLKEQKMRQYELYQNKYGFFVQEDDDTLCCCVVDSGFSLTHVVPTVNAKAIVSSLYTSILCVCTVLQNKNTSTKILCFTECE